MLAARKNTNVRVAVSGSSLELGLHTLVALDEDFSMRIWYKLLHLWNRLKSEKQILQAERKETPYPVRLLASLCCLLPLCNIPLFTKGQHDSDNAGGYVTGCQCSHKAKVSHI